MLRGNVNAAIRLLDNNSSGGVVKLSDETIKELESKHPKASPANKAALLQGEIPFTDPVLFSNIDEDSIAKAALKTKGAAGPSGLDADGWRRILVSKNFGKQGKDLRSAIARMTIRMCTKETNTPIDKSTNLEKLYCL